MGQCVSLEETKFCGTLNVTIEEFGGPCRVFHAAELASFVLDALATLTGQLSLINDREWDVVQFDPKEGTLVVHKR